MFVNVKFSTYSLNNSVFRALIVRFSNVKLLRWYLSLIHI